MLTASYVSDALNGRQVAPNQWVAPCPCGPHSHARLYLSDGRDGRLLLDCKSPGCSYESVREALKERGLYPKLKRSIRPQCRTKASRKPVGVARLRRLWESCKGAVVEHPYAIRKEVSHDFGARRGAVNGVFPQEEDCLVIPMFDLEGDVVGLELINQQGEKRAVGKKGWNFQGSNQAKDSILHIVEGWATGHAVAEDFPVTHGVVICFGAQRLTAYAHEAQKRLGRPVYIHEEPSNRDYLDMRQQNPAEAAAYREAVLEKVASYG